MPVARAHGGIERRFHGEPRTEQSHAPQPALPRFLRAHLDDAQERDGRSCRELVEHDVGGVGGHRGEVRAGAREPSQRVEQVLGQRRSIAAHQAQGELDVEAVDHDRGRVGPAGLRPRVEDAPVVVDRGFRTQPADDPDSRHVDVRLVDHPPRPK
jgi:hypothetical protein